MDNLLGFLGITAADAAIENTENQITFENFIMQTKELNILIDKKKCIEKSSLELKSIYNFIYEKLLQIGIIEKTITKFMLFQAGRSHFITKDILKLEPQYIQQKLEEINEIQKIKECFDIDYNKLSIFLKNYKYNPQDQFNLLIKKGGRNSKKRITTRSRSSNNRRPRRNKKTIHRRRRHRAIIL